jgi:uncharacterized membrane protein YfcA
MLHQLPLLLTGFVASFFSALAGGGAGLVQFPALIALGLPFTLAIVTHKVAVVALGVGSSTKLLRSYAFDWKFIALMLVAGVPGLIIGNLSALAIPAAPGKVLFGVTNIAMALYSILRPGFGVSATPRNREGRGLWIGTGLMGLVGFLCGVFPSGPGLFATLVLLRWFGFDYQGAVASTMLMVGLVWNSIAGVTVAVAAPVRWDWIPALALGGVLGGYFGSSLALLKGNRFIKRAFETVTLLMGAWLLLQGLENWQ